MRAGGPRSGALRARRLGRGRAAPVALAAALALLGCSGPEGGWPVLGPERPARPWAGFENAGALPVAGAEASAPGPAIYRYVAGRPELAGFLRSYGRPDRLEVVRRGDAPLRIWLRYSGREGGCRIRLERSSEGAERWSAALPDCPRARRAPPSPAPRPQVSEPEVSEPEAPEPTPTARCAPPSALQRLECPIDPARDDCAALCRCDATLEWCD